MKAYPERRPKTRDANIKPRSDGQFDVDVQLSKPNGQRWRKRAMGLTSKAAARQVRDDLYRKFNAEVLGIVDGPLHLRSEGQTMHEWLDECLKEHWPKRIPQTVRGYRTSVHQHIKPFFPDLPLKDMRAKHLTDFLDALNKARPDLSVSTIRSAVGTIKSATTLALELEKIPAHPFRGTKLRWRALERERRIRNQGVPKRRLLLSQEEVEGLLAALDGTIYYPVVLLQAYLGLRVGEALALEVGDFDFRHGTVTVSKQLKRIEDDDGAPSRLALVPPKTEAGHRTIPAHPRVLDYAKTCDRLLCPNQDGGWIDPDNVKNRLSAAARSAGYPGISSHVLRHTWISRLLNEHRVPHTVVRDLAGHTNIATTLKYYSHSSDEQLRSAINKL
jgi:integrase